MKTTRIVPVAMLALAAACGGTGQDWAADDDGFAESEDGLTAAQRLAGQYFAAAPTVGTFVSLSLQADGTYDSETLVECIRAPCNPSAVHGRWSAGLYYVTLSGVRYSYAFRTGIAGKKILTLHRYKYQQTLETKTALDTIPGYYSDATAGAGERVALWLRSDATYTSWTQIYCFTTPCYPIEETGRWSAGTTYLTMNGTRYSYLIRYGREGGKVLILSRYDYSQTFYYESTTPPPATSDATP